MRTRMAGLTVAIGLTAAASVAIVALSWHPGALSHPGWAGGPNGPALERTRGTLERIDARARTLTLFSEEAAFEVQLDEATTIFVGGRSTGLEALRVGDELCATWEPGPFLPTAQWIEPCPPPASPTQREAVR